MDFQAIDAEARSERAYPWLYRFLVTVLASVFAVLLLPLAAFLLAAEWASDWHRARQFDREVKLAQRQMYLLSRRVRHHLSDQLNEQERILNEFLDGDYATLDQARRAWAMTNAAQDAVLAGSRRILVDLANGDASEGSILAGHHKPNWGRP